MGPRTLVASEANEMARWGALLVPSAIPCNLSSLISGIHSVNRRGGVVVRASASQSVDLGFIPLVESYQKTLKKWYPQLPCLALGIYGRLWRTSRQVRLLCTWARHLTGRLRLYVEDRWPRHLKNGNSQASADFPSKI